MSLPRTFGGPEVEANDREWHAWCFYWDKTEAAILYKDNRQVVKKKSKTATICFRSFRNLQMRWSS